MGGALTVSERILFHLNNYIKYEDRFEVPFDVTQDGISQAISISRAHAAIELKKLRSSGLIEERLSHIRKGKSRRKAYSLTAQGKTLAATVVQYTKDNGIDPMVDQSKITPTTGGLGRQRTSRKSSPLPATRTFLGREKELAALAKALDAPTVKIVSVKGIAGIGRTTLVSKLASGLSDQRVFWYSVRPWDTPVTVTESLSRFFSDNGSRKMCSYVASGRVDLGEISVLLKEELSENGYVFVFDDVDCAPGLLDFLTMFRHSSGTAKIVVVSEDLPRFYDRSDVVARSEVFELELKGLDTRSALRMLESRGMAGESAEKLVSMTKGHPLSLEMITVSGLSEARTQVARFLEEKYYSGLSDSEKSLLQLASVFNEPFPREAIPRDLRGCRKGSMLREVAPGLFEIHSTIRDFVYDSMDPRTRSSWHSVAADHYLREGHNQERLYHLLKANRSLEAEMLVDRLGGTLLEKGDVQRIWSALEGFTPKKDRYSRSVHLLKAKAASMVGDCGSAEDLLRRLSADPSGPVKAEALIEMGEMCSRRGDLQEASKMFSEALDSCADMPGLRSKALRGMGVVEDRMGNHGKAQELLDASAKDALAAVDPRGMLLAHLELGNVFMRRGMYEEAMSHFSKCAAGFGPVELAKIYTDMGVACSCLDRQDEAKRNLENAVRLSCETGQPRLRARAQSVLSDVLLKAGDPDAAKECCFAALEVFTELGDKVGTSAVYANLASVERSSGDLSASEEHYRESLTALQGEAPSRDMAMRQLALASLLAEKGDMASARALLEEVLRVTSGSGADDLSREAESMMRSLGEDADDRA